jgi:hypothetical protein
MSAAGLSVGLAGHGRLVVHGGRVAVVPDHELESVPPPPEGPVCREVLRRPLEVRGERAGSLGSELDAVQVERDVVVGVDVDLERRRPAPLREPDRAAVPGRGRTRLVRADGDPLRARDRVRPEQARREVPGARAAALRDYVGLVPGCPPRSAEPGERVAAWGCVVAADEGERPRAVATVALRRCGEGPRDDEELSKEAETAVLHGVLLPRPSLRPVTRESTADLEHLSERLVDAPDGAIARA